MMFSLPLGKLRVVPGNAVQTLDRHHVLSGMDSQ